MEPQQTQAPETANDLEMLYQEQIHSSQEEDHDSQIIRESQPKEEFSKQMTPVVKKGSTKRKHKVYPPTRVLFVRNLPHDATESDLKRVFEEYGPVEKALIMIQKSHAFVQFKNLDDAKKCLGDLCVDMMINHESQNSVGYEKS